MAVENEAQQMGKFPLCSRKRPLQTLTSPGESLRLSFSPLRTSKGSITGPEVVTRNQFSP